VAAAHIRQTVRRRWWRRIAWATLAYGGGRERAAAGGAASRGWYRLAFEGALASRGTRRVGDGGSILVTMVSPTYIISAALFSQAQHRLAINRVRALAASNSA